MAVGNPTLQRALAERRAALGMSQPDPEAETSTDPNPSANYFDDDDFFLKNYLVSYLILFQIFSILKLLFYKIYIIIIIN
ncbi:hypothetical protein YC2023_013843 [Brassica napus]